MSCVVTGAPFSMLAELPITTASSLARRSALASATSVFSDRSEDVPAVLPLVDEHGAPLRRQEQAANDETQIALNKLAKGDRKASSEDLLWSLYNKVDFIFNY